MEEEHLMSHKLYDSSNEVDEIVYNISRDIEIMEEDQNKESDNDLKVKNTDVIVVSGNEMDDYDTLSEASSSSSSDDSYSSGHCKRQKMDDESRSPVAKDSGSSKPKDRQEKINSRKKDSYKTKASYRKKDVTTKKEGSKGKDSVKRKISSRKKNSSTEEDRNSTLSYIKKLNFLFRDARFFVIKSNNTENIDIAKDKGVWSTLPRNEKKLSEAFKSSQNVILIFSARESGKFTGFARIALNVDYTIPPVPWVVPQRLKESNIFGGTFKIDWICKKELPFSSASSFRNPWNEGKPVKIARDGQEIEPTVAEELCRLFPQDDDIDIVPILRKSKQAVTKENNVKHHSVPPVFHNLPIPTRNDSSKWFQNTKRFDHTPRSIDSRDRSFMQNGVKADNNSYHRWGEGTNSAMNMYFNNFSHTVRPPIRGTFVPPPKIFPFMPPPPPPGYFAMVSQNFPRARMLHDSSFKNYSRFPPETKNERHKDEKYPDRRTERNKGRRFRR